ncbi:hypothetical protein [Candidatus Parabeggiatoa sp. HSG14]|uniref:hypothetical protein n=1 Tax=Candidatus Parabeggiatoa sp. HSG14 TaxID=3055593 RepID=UPI0025A86E04|nr:hypothetical protein [Thiotrichales bacterium HSG14]
MSYILDAIKKSEREREFVQFIDYKYNYQKKPLLFPQTDFWLWISIILAMNMLSWGVLLWPKEPIPPPQVYFVSPIAPNKISLPARVTHSQSHSNGQNFIHASTSTFINGE